MPKEEPNILLAPKELNENFLLNIYFDIPVDYIIPVSQQC